MSVTLLSPPERARAVPPFPERALARPAARPAAANAGAAGSDGDPWVEVDGRGGYASVARDGGPPRRSSEGLLVVPVGARRAPHVLVASLDERAGLPGATAVDPQRVTAGTLVSPWHDLEVVCDGPLAEAAGGCARVRREVLQPRGRHATLVRWTLLAGPELTWRVRPRLPFRAAAATTERNPTLDPSAVEVGGAVLVRPYASLPALRIGADDPLGFEPAARWHVGVELAAAGVSEDLFSPGELTFALRRGAPVTLEFAVAGEASGDPGAAFRAELARRAAATPEQLAVERLVARTDAGTLTLAAAWPLEDLGAERSAGRESGPSEPLRLGLDTLAALPGLAGALGLARAVEALEGQLRALEHEPSVAASELDALWFAWATRRLLAAHTAAGLDAASLVSPAQVAELEAALGSIGAAFVASLELGRDADLGVTLTPSATGGCGGLDRARELVSLALGVDLLAALAGRAAGSSRRRWAVARRRGTAAFLAALHGASPGATWPSAQAELARAELVAAMLEHSPLPLVARRALVASYAERLEREGPSALGPDELDWYTEAALRVAPPTRARLAALAELWRRDARPHGARTARTLGAWLHARATLEEAPR